MLSPYPKLPPSLKYTTLLSWFHCSHSKPFSIGTLTFKKSQSVTSHFTLGKIRIPTKASEAIYNLASTVFCTSLCFLPLSVSPPSITMLQPPKLAFFQFLKHNKLFSTPGIFHILPCREGSSLRSSQIYLSNV